MPGGEEAEVFGVRGAAAGAALRHAAAQGRSHPGTELNQIHIQAGPSGCTLPFVTIKKSHGTVLTPYTKTQL